MGSWAPKKVHQTMRVMAVEHKRQLGGEFEVQRKAQALLDMDCGNEGLHSVLRGKLNRLVRKIKGYSESEALVILIFVSGERSCSL